MKILGDRYHYFFFQIYSRDSPPGEGLGRGGHSHFQIYSRDSSLCTDYWTAAVASVSRYVAFKSILEILRVLARLIRPFMSLVRWTFKSILEILVPQSKLTYMSTRTPLSNLF